MELNRDEAFAVLDHLAKRGDMFPDMQGNALADAYNELGHDVSNLAAAVRALLA